MKIKDIKKAREKDPETLFAVKKPRMVYGRRDGSQIVHTPLMEATSRGVLVPTGHPGDWLPLSAVVATSASYKMDEAHAAALFMNNRIDEAAEYEKRRAVIDAQVEAAAPAFDGVMVPAEALSSANFDRPDVDLGVWLRETFRDRRTAGATVGLDAFVAVAKRINDLSEAALAASSGWGEGPVDTGRPVVEGYVALAPVEDES